jgi:hypothetical protein
MIRHLLARGYNAKEKPVERFFRDLSSWEKNTFAEYCGSHPEERPDAWRKLYAQHQQHRNGKLAASPFMAFARYREELAGYIERYNLASHERPTLGGASVVPLEEYRRLYTTPYQISTKAITTLLMKAEGRSIRKDGVQCFQKHWFYWHERMSEYKGAKVEIRYTDRDYRRIWVVLPDGDLCEAKLLTPTSLLHPNRETLKTVAKARAHERKLIRDFHLIVQSEVRGKGVEDRVQVRLPEPSEMNMELPSATVRRLTRFDRRALAAVARPQAITAAEVGQVASDHSMFMEAVRVKVSEFDEDD